MRISIVLMRSSVNMKSMGLRFCAALKAFYKNQPLQKGKNINLNISVIKCSYYKGYAGKESGTHGYFARYPNFDVMKFDNLST